MCGWAIQSKAQPHIVNATSIFLPDDTVCSTANEVVIPNTTPIIVLTKRSKPTLVGILLRERIPKEKVDSKYMDLELKAVTRR
jgi:hypothetical protein